MSKITLCPICKIEKEDEKFSPFCSSRCGDADLYHWMSGGYGIEAVELPDDFEQQLEQATMEEKYIH